MQVSDYDYQLPEELIAQYPPEERTDSRLLVVKNSGELHDRAMPELLDYLQPEDLLVLNDTRVIPARVYGRKPQGGRVEILLERITADNQVLVQIRSSRSPKPGQRLSIDNDANCVVTVLARQDNFFVLEIDSGQGLPSWFEQVGHIPLPPYIERSDNPRDVERYQTVFAKAHGAVAAPTAGLHYDDQLLAKVRAKGVNIETLTLHVGAGTFQPVRTNNVAEHKMHSEYIDVPQSVCDAITRTRQQRGRVVAVGTTVVRSLETAAQASNTDIVEPYTGDTDIFIYPGYQFKVVDMLQTNFHLPKSTLLMLVSAFAGKDVIDNAYQHAIQQKYRFFSYGDAMLLERHSEN